MSKLLSMMIVCVFLVCACSLQPHPAAVASLDAVDVAKQAMLEYYFKTGFWSVTNKQAGLPSPLELSGEGVSRIVVSASGVISVIYTSPVTDDPVRNSIVFFPTVTLTQGREPVVTWDCRMGRLPNELRPYECRVVQEPWEINHNNPR